MPHDRDSNELERNDLCLLDEQGAVLSHVVQNRVRRGASRCTLALACHEQRIENRLRVLSANAHQKLINQISHR